MNRYFTEAAVIQLRDAIADAGGNEVFFLGRTDEAKIVFEAEPLARGNRDAVAAIMIAASFGDVVIHNHPSGNLTPSQADLEIASILGNQGVGFYIVDNRVERCYQAVSPFSRPEVERLSYAEVERWYTPGGTLASALRGYEHREEQTRMAFAVAEAFNEDRVAVIEAGTGTGKSLAYLLPAILWATRNKERVVVSTNTINLQEQLTRKDLPFLHDRGLQFRAVLVKGRSNYLCLRKVGAIAEEPALFPEEGAAELQAIVDWSATTASGCRNDLSFIPKDDIWDEVCCEADQCGRVKCPFYSRCFFYTARREASTADILVVNHALLMADVAVRQQTGYSSSAILPPFSRLIFDEGHHMEDVATSHLSAHLSRQGLLKHLTRLQHPRKLQRGLLPQLSTQLSREIPETMDDLYMEVSGLLETSLLPKRMELAATVDRAMDAVAMTLLSHLKGKENTEQKLRLVPSLYGTSFWLETEQKLKELVEALVDYISGLNAFLKACRILPDSVLDKMGGNLVDLKGIKGRLEGAVEQLLFFIGRDEGFCRWFEVKRGTRGLILRLCASPLEVAESIKTVIFDKFKTVVLTSATLAVGERFDYLEKRTGINLLDRSRVTQLLLRSPFDYAHQAYVGIPADVPEPTAAGFERALEDGLLDSLAISHGRAFILFTSYDLLRRIFTRIEQPLRRLGITSLRQGEINRHLLLSRFRKEPNAALFATDSFWEGVDVQGKALELVVITRLPFRVPTEPILAARAEHITATGGDPFMEYTIPQAVIKFKQGFGRLIRSRDDRGAVLIFDSRVLTKNYGRYFLDALPGALLVKGSTAEVMGGMEDFFTRSPGVSTQEG